MLTQKAFATASRLCSYGVRYASAVALAEPYAEPAEWPAVHEALASGKLHHRQLEDVVGPQKAVHYRRLYLQERLGVSMSGLPYDNYDFEATHKMSCENPIGYTPIPTGVAGPLLWKPVNSDRAEEVFVPMATTEGALVASTNRGCVAIAKSGGVVTSVEDVGMTRAPGVTFPSHKEALECCQWVREADTFKLLKEAFESTSRFAKLREVKPLVYGPDVYFRFTATTGDAMGMNMLTKGSKAAVDVIRARYPRMRVVVLANNMCADKKATAINWINGRGKSVTAVAVIPAAVVERVLKITVDVFVEGERMALRVASPNVVSIGGQNVHAANMVAAIFLATGQDPAQLVSSSMCDTEMRKTESGDLHVRCVMRCLEVGTVGGGTALAPQAANLRLLGCSGAHPTQPGENANRLAQIVCATVLAGDLSLGAATCTLDHLLDSHMKLNRSKRQTA